MNAVVSVVGKDCVGILANISGISAKRNANVIEVTQQIIDNLFTMMMVVNIDHLNSEFNDYVDELVSYGNENNLKIHVMHEDIFKSMHRI